LKINTSDKKQAMFDISILLAQTTNTIQIGININGIVALIAGILILLLPRLLNYIVAIYLIIIGLVQIFNFRI
jgi:hypothetical protein